MKVTLPDGLEVEIDPTKNLRKNLKNHWDQVYHPIFKTLHCRGLGSCGTCAIKIQGELTPPTTMEKWRLNFPPHKNGLSKGLRLACQVYAKGDLKIEKGEGLWGHKTS